MRAPGARSMTCAARTATRPRPPLGAGCGADGRNLSAHAAEHDGPDRSGLSGLAIGCGRGWCRAAPARRRRLLRGRRRGAGQRGQHLRPSARRARRGRRRPPPRAAPVPAPPGGASPPPACSWPHRLLELAQEGISSDCASIELVGSSISRICGCVTRQRASATSWRWPPDSSAAHLAHRQLPALRVAGGHAVQPGEARHLGQPRGVDAARGPSARCRAGAVEQPRVLRDEAHAARKSAGSIWRRSMPSTSTRPSVGWYSPASSAARSTCRCRCGRGWPRARRARTSASRS
jgi:hypothetical protein